MLQKRALPRNHEKRFGFPTLLLGIFLVATGFTPAIWIGVVFFIISLFGFPPRIISKD